MEASEGGCHDGTPCFICRFGTPHLLSWLLSPSIKSNQMFCSMFSYRRPDSVFFVTWLALHTHFKMLSFQAKHHESELLNGISVKCWRAQTGSISADLKVDGQVLIRCAKWVIPHTLCCQSKWNLKRTPNEWQRASYCQIFEDTDCSRWDQRWRQAPYGWLLLKWKRHFPVCCWFCRMIWVSRNGHKLSENTF